MEAPTDLNQSSAVQACGCASQVAVLRSDSGNQLKDALNPVDLPHLCDILMSLLCLWTH